MRRLCCKTMLLVAVVQLQPLSAQTVRLTEKLDATSCFDITSTVNVTGSLEVQAAEKAKNASKRFSATGFSRYQERILNTRSDSPTSWARLYQRAVVRRTEGKNTEEVTAREQVKRVIGIRHNHQTVAFSPDAPLTEEEIDLYQAEVASAILSGLFPDRAVSTSDSWTISPIVCSELTGVSPIEQGQLSCRLDRITESAAGRFAEVKFRGTLIGPTEQGPARQTIDGRYRFNISKSHLSQLVLNATSEIIEDGRMVGKLRGRYELNRRPIATPLELNDPKLADYTQRRTRSNTAVLFKDSRIAMIYPRNWSLSGGSSNRYLLQEPTGASMRISFFDKPTSLARVRTGFDQWIKKQKASIELDRPIAKSQSQWEGFRVRGRIGESKQHLEFIYLVKQWNGRTCAIQASVRAAEAARLGEDVVFVADNVRVPSR